jgi:perosamine synthetase
MNPEKAGTVNGYWMPSIIFDDGVALDWERLLAAFREESIDGRVFFWPLSLLPMFSPQPENRVSHGIYSRASNLPSYHDLDEEQIQRVCDVIRLILNPRSQWCKNG